MRAICLTERTRSETLGISFLIRFRLKVINQFSRKAGRAINPAFIFNNPEH
jgi:hypothetical protein